MLSVPPSIVKHRFPSLYMDTCAAVTSLCEWEKNNISAPPGFSHIDYPEYELRFSLMQTQYA